MNTSVVIYKVITGKYYDSVSLMLVTKAIREQDKVTDVAVVMATEANKKILEAAGLWLAEMSKTSENDIIIAVRANNTEMANSAIADAIHNLNAKKISSLNASPEVRTLNEAVSKFPNLDIALISVAGRYATQLTREALSRNLHVMLFSDNVSLADEIELKHFAHEKKLLLMGPDCGTSIINGVPLAFANALPRGRIGIVGASGTGIQEISCLIAMQGEGISSAIGTGGRDLKKEVGGIMFIDALETLANDAKTEVIVLVGKPPDLEVLQKLQGCIANINTRYPQKTIIGHFLGASIDSVKSLGVIPATSLENAALLAVAYAQKQNLEVFAKNQRNKMQAIEQLAASLKTKIPNANFIRGLFCGGTLAQETLLILAKECPNITIHSNLHAPNAKLLHNVAVSSEHTIIDMGDDDFTVGRPHPMIDDSLRADRFMLEAQDEKVALIIFDVVLGFGSNLKPVDLLLARLNLAKEKFPCAKNKIFIASVTGTNADVQNRQKICDTLTNAGVIVMPSNAAASLLVAKIISQ